MSFIARSPYFYELLTSEGKLWRFTKNADVRTGSDANKCMLVCKGFVKRYMIKADGSIAVQIIYGPQDVFSLTWLYRQLSNFSLYDGPETYYYQAMNDVELYSIDTKIVEAAAGII